MAITTFTPGQILTAAQMNAVQGNDYNQTVSTKTASYTLVAADKGTRVVMNSASGTTITVNTSLFSAGDTVVLQNIGAGVTTVTAGTATVSSAGPLAIPQYGSGTLYFTSAGVAIFFPSAVTVAAPAASALTLITTGTITNTTSVDNCFSATYKNYKIVLNDIVGGTAAATRWRFRVGGTDNSSSVYSNGALGQAMTTPNSPGNAGVTDGGTSIFMFEGNNGADGQSVSFDLFNPFEAKNTIIGIYSNWQYTDETFVMLNGIHASTTSFDGFTIFPSASTLAGSYKIYGYANS